MLRTKSIYASLDLHDGLRVCVMSRLTENDGNLPLFGLVKGQGIDYWAKILAPLPKLVGAWYRKELEWPQFEEGYKEHLSAEQVSREARMWAERARSENVTFLCVETSPRHCHRRLLAEHCARLAPGLELRIE